MSGKTVWAIAGVLFLAGIPLFVHNPYFLHVFILIFLYGAISGAWNIIAGYAGQFSLGHAAFFGIGAYTSTLLFLKLGVTPWLGMVAGGLLSALVSVLIFYPCFKLKGIFFALATLAFGEVIMQVSIYWRGLTRGSLGLMIPFRPSFYNMMFESKLGYYYITLIFLLGIIFLSYSIEKSKMGFYLKAIKDDEDAAEAMAIDTAQCKLLALLISSFLTSVGGSLYAQYITLIEPEVAFSLLGFPFKSPLYRSSEESGPFWARRSALLCWSPWGNLSGIFWAGKRRDPCHDLWNHGDLDCDPTSQRGHALDFRFGAKKNLRGLRQRDDSGSRKAQQVFRRPAGGQ